MNRSLRLIAAVLLLAAVTSIDVRAQSTGTLVGVVTDVATQLPLAGVQVQVVGTDRSAITNQQGNFRIPDVPAGQHALRSTLLGYAADDTTVVVQAGETTRLVIGLSTAAIELDGIVVNAVTGRAERKRELGTNTASISAADIQRAPITKMADVLVGRAAGVQLQGVSGSLGTSQRIRIRGANSISLSNEPLVFVDGVMYSNSQGGFAMGGQTYSRLNDLNPEDIAGIEILKGPAASALYGTAAANGVILITTRRGQSGGTEWRAYAELASSKDRNDYPDNYLPFQVNDASSAMFTSRGNLNTAGGAYRFCPLFAQPAAGPSLSAGTCTQDENLKLNPFRTAGLSPFTTGSRRKLGMSVSGGTDDVTYYVSGDREDEDGVIVWNEQSRTNLRSNLHARVRENIGVNVSAGYTRTSLWLNGNDNNVFGPLINSLLATPAVPTAEQRIALPPGQRWGTGFGFYVPDLEHTLSQQIVDRFVVGSSTSYEPIPWLSLNASLGMDYFGRKDATTRQPNRLPISANSIAGFRNAQRASSYMWTANAGGTATFQLTGDLASTTTIGGSFSREQFESTFCGGVGIIEGTRSCSATSDQFSVSETYTEVRTIGGYLQQQLNWRDRLILSGSIRGDDNSAFGQDFGFIYYPGMSVSWVASEEPFFPQVGFLNHLRLRAAYGRSGQRPNVRDAVTLLEPVAVTSAGTELSAVRLSRVGNRDLKPERTTEYEAGLDAGLLSDRLSLEFTYFRKESQDALISRPLAPSHGLTGDGPSTGSIFDNLGRISNWGTEVALNARLVSTPAAGLTVRLAASTLDNRIDDMGGIPPIVINRGEQAHKQGFPTGAYHARRYEIVDPDRQRILTPDDLIMIDDTAVFVGRMQPTSTQSLSSELRLFGNLITISGLLDRRAGHQQMNQTESFRCQTGYNNGLQNAARGQCAGVADPNASLEAQAAFLARRFGARHVDGTGQVTYVTTPYGYIEDADFIKLRELSLTLSAPESLARRFTLLRGASVTLSGRNLATWTDYTGIDPEANETGGSNFNQAEFNTQPALRYYTLRVNVSF
ncbi:MAG TPA: SusC/RagA family TonB-linked outer membrane protein [Longimicrobiales bacterium]